MPSDRIPVILTVYKKPDLFKSQMESLCQQSCIDQIDLHIISNNSDIDFESMTAPFVNNVKIHFVQKHNQYGPFERHFYAHEQKFKYFIILDDDIVIQNITDIQKIFDSKEPRTFKGGWLRRWGELGSSHTYNKSVLERPGDPSKEYNYCGTALSIVDCAIYDSVIKWFPVIHNKLVEQHQLNIYDFDDMFISWVCAVADFKVTSHGTNFIQLSHEEALHNKIVSKKNLVINFLHNIHPWKILSNVQYRKEQVQQLYRDILKREADYTGLAHYVSSNLPFDEIKRILLNSEEYKRL